MTAVEAKAVEQAVMAVAVAAGTAIEALGARWMLHPEQVAASAEAGFMPPFAGYFAGRAGVLGDVDASIVAATLAVFEPGVVAQMWRAGTKTHTPRQSARIYTRHATEWAGRHLAGAADLDGFIELTDRVMEAAPAAGLPLFAGWRALPRTEDPPGRAIQNALVLREFQGGVHISALTAAGIGPVEAHLLNKGEQYCAFFGWPAPFPDVAEHAAAYEVARHQTHQRMASLIRAVLSPTEAEELARIATGLNSQLHQ